MAKKLARGGTAVADVAKAFAESLNLEATLESILQAGVVSHLERGALRCWMPSGR